MTVIELYEHLGRGFERGRLSPFDRVFIFDEENRRYDIVNIYTAKYEGKDRKVKGSICFGVKKARV